MFCGLIILNCTIKTRRIYFGAATEGIRPKISFTLVLLVHVPYPTFPQLSSFKSLDFLIFPFFAIKLEMAFPYIPWGVNDIKKKKLMCQRYGQRKPIIPEIIGNNRLKFIYYWLCLLFSLRINIIKILRIFLPVINTGSTRQLRIVKILFLFFTIFLKVISFIS